MSAPAPVTVNMPLVQPADPEAPVTPMSRSSHGPIGPSKAKAGAIREGSIAVTPMQTCSNLICDAVLIWTLSGMGLITKIGCMKPSELQGDKIWVGAGLENPAAGLGRHEARFRKARRSLREVRKKYFQSLIVPAYNARSTQGMQLRQGGLKGEPRIWTSRHRLFRAT